MASFSPSVSPSSHSARLPILSVDLPSPPTTTASCTSSLSPTPTYITPDSLPWSNRADPPPSQYLAHLCTTDADMNIYMHRQTDCSLWTSQSYSLAAALDLHPSLNQQHHPLTIPKAVNTAISPISSHPSPRASTHSRAPAVRDHHDHRHHPYRSSSRQSTASSSAEGDNDEEPPHSDYDYATSSSVMGDRRDSIELLGRSNSLNEGRAGRELGRADSFRSTGGGHGSTRTTGPTAYEGRYSGHPMAPGSNYAQTLSSALSSPATSSPTFSFGRSDATGAFTHPHPHSHSSSPTTSYSPSGAHQQQATSPISLDSLPSYPSDQKPPFSYPVLIRLAILGSPQKRLLLSQIYAAIEEKFPWYKESAPKAWKVSTSLPTAVDQWLNMRLQASVRHCLSLNKEFVRMQRAVEDPGVGCGGWWSVSEGTKGEREQYSLFLREHVI